jgi:tetratricopeptide (TPR) repeat protein
MGVFFGSLKSDGTCNHKTEHVGAMVHSGTKAVLQRWYYETFLVPAGHEDQVLCDIGNNCRHYIYKPERFLATQAGQAGKDLLTKGKHAAAEVEFKRALKVYPTAPYAAAWYGEMLFNAGRKEEAKPHFENAVAAAGAFADALYFLGSILLDTTKEYEEASVVFGRMAKYQPKDQDAHYMLAQALMKLWMQVHAPVGGGGSEAGLRVLAEAEAAVKAHLKKNKGDGEAKALTATVAKMTKAAKAAAAERAQTAEAQTAEVSPAVVAVEVSAAGEASSAAAEASAEWEAAVTGPLVGLLLFADSGDQGGDSAEFGAAWAEFAASLKRCKVASVDTAGAAGAALAAKHGVRKTPSIRIYRKAPTARSEAQGLDVMPPGEVGTAKGLRRKLKALLKGLRKDASGMFVKAGGGAEAGPGSSASAGGGGAKPAAASAASGTAGGKGEGARVVSEGWVGELGDNGGWRVAGDKVSALFDTGVCNIERLAGLSEADFLAHYDTKKPFILTDATAGWRAEAFSRDEMLEKWGKEEVKAGLSKHIPRNSGDG